VAAARGAPFRAQHRLAGGRPLARLRDPDQPDDRIRPHAPPRRRARGAAHQRDDQRRLGDVHPFEPRRAHRPAAMVAQRTGSPPVAPLDRPRAAGDEFLHQARGLGRPLRHPLAAGGGEARGLRFDLRELPTGLPAAAPVRVPAAGRDRRTGRTGEGPGVSTPFCATLLLHV